LKSIVPKISFPAFRFVTLFGGARPMNEEAYEPEVEEILSTISRSETRFSDLAKRVNNLNSATLSILPHDAGNDGAEIGEAPLLPNAG
jgi:hypothetical protein